MKFKPNFLKNAVREATLTFDQAKEILANWLTVNAFFQTDEDTLENVRYLLYLEINGRQRVQIINKLMARAMVKRRLKEIAELNELGIKTGPYRGE